MQCHAIPCNAMQCNQMPCHAMPCHAKPCNTIQCHATQCHATPCNAMQHHAMQSNAMLRQATPCNARGEYFYSVGVQGLQVIFFSSCRNIQFGVFRAEIFILWCIVQKYWSGIVTCYMKMRQINELHADLASFLFNCARKNAFCGGSC